MRRLGLVVKRDSGIWGFTVQDFKIVGLRSNPKLPATLGREGSIRFVTFVRS